MVLCIYGFKIPNEKKCGWNIWIGIGLALIGLYLLCMKGSFSLQLPDLLLLLCALGFSFHILCVDHFSPLVDGIKLSCVQFLVAGIVSLIPAFFIDMQHSFANIPSTLAAFGAPAALISLLRVLLVQPQVLLPCSMPEFFPPVQAIHFR